MILFVYLTFKAYSALDSVMHLLKVHFAMKSTYRTIPYDDDDDDDLQSPDAESKEHGGNPGAETRNRSQWDDDCSWSEWYSAEDPVKGNLMFRTLHIISLFGYCPCFLFDVVLVLAFGIWWVEIFFHPKGHADHIRGLVIHMLK